MLDTQDIAHQILADLQAAFAAHDLTAAQDLFAEDAVLFGTAAECLDGEGSREYLSRVMTEEGTLRWGWDHVVCLSLEGTSMAFAVVGTVGFDDADGREGERDSFRASLLALHRDGRWRIKHFHGSIPQR